MALPTLAPFPTKRLYCVLVSVHNHQWGPAMANKEEKPKKKDGKKKKDKKKDKNKK